MYLWGVVYRNHTSCGAPSLLFVHLLRSELRENNHTVKQPVAQTVRMVGWSGGAVCVAYMLRRFARPANVHVYTAFLPESQRTCEQHEKKRGQYSPQPPCPMRIRVIDTPSSVRVCVGCVCVCVCVSGKQPMVRRFGILLLLFWRLNFVDLWKRW